MSHTYSRVPLNMIRLVPQTRKHIDPIRIESMAASMRQTGLHFPPLCRPCDGAYVPIDGECRIRAALLLGWTDIDIIVADGELSPTDALSIQLVCNIQRSDLTPVERAMGIESLRKSTGGSVEEVAKLIGLSAATVARSLAILSLPEDTQSKVAAGSISADAAYLLSRVDDTEAQKQLATEVSNGMLSRDALARKLKASRRSDERRSTGLSRCTAVLSDGRSVTLSGKGLSLDVLIDLVEQLLMRARKAKAQGLTLETLVRAMRDQANGPKAVRP